MLLHTLALLGKCPMTHDRPFGHHLKSQPAAPLLLPGTTGPASHNPASGLTQAIVYQANATQARPCRYVHAMRTTSHCLSRPTPPSSSRNTTSRGSGHVSPPSSPCRPITPGQRRHPLVMQRLDRCHHVLPTSLSNWLSFALSTMLPATTHRNPCPACAN